MKFLKGILGKKKQEKSPSDEEAKIKDRLKKLGYMD